jgi:molybdopterin-binding protein
MLSARNQLPAVVKEVNSGGIMAEVIMVVDGRFEIVAVITRDSAERLALKVGDQVTAIVKATEVLVAKG